MKYFVDKLINFAAQSGYRPLTATSTQEAFLAAGFQFGSTYPEPMFIQRAYPCPYLAYSNVFESRSNNEDRVNGPLANPTALYKGPNNVIKPRLRDFFPEVWFFDVIAITDRLIKSGGDDNNIGSNVQMVVFNETNKANGIELNLTVPDTITSWRASAYCTTKENGLWFGEPQTLTVTMPFYAEITLPKEMKRGEILHIPISVFILDRKYLKVINDNQNTTTECYEIFVKLHVNDSEWSITTSNHFSGCLCSGDKNTYLLGLLPQRLGHLNITVEAFAIKDSHFCELVHTGDILTFEPDQMNRKLDESKILSDKIRRQIHVIPEGVQHETTLSDIICLNEQQNTSTREFQFKLPENIIKDSLHSYISYSDEVLGPALVNLDNLIRLPTGCGEQNMVLVAPNVYILDYLKSTPTIGLNDNKEKYIQSAQSHITSGYYQQMKYRRDDGSFSAFGKSDKHGSTWLTAFVLRVFGKAYKLQPDLNIDWSSIFNEPTEYLLTHQNNQTGCFEEYGKVLYSPLQGISGIDEIQWKEILLTSYVSSALYEIQTKPTDEDNENKSLNYLGIKKYTTEIQASFKSAFNCLNTKLLNLTSFEEIPTSALVQLSYTYTLIQPVNNNLTIELQNEVIKRKQLTTDQFGTKMYWSDYLHINNTTTDSNVSLSDERQSTYQDKHEPRSLESTAYAFLTLSHMNQSIGDLFSIIRWISSQQKSNGGFYSTQDTVLGLESIAKFSKILGLTRSNNSTELYNDILSISNRMNVDMFTMNDLISLEKRQVINQIELPYTYLNNNDSIIYSLWKLQSNQTQTDCILVQNTFIYNLPEKKDVDKTIKLTFDTIQQNILSDVDCRLANLSICIQLNNIHDTNSINTEQLTLQLGFEDESLKKFTINEQNEISLYFDGFTIEESQYLSDWKKLKRCINVPLKQTHYVQNTKTAIITALQYYTPDESVIVTYQLDECKQAWNITEREITIEPLITTENILINQTTTLETILVNKTQCPICVQQVNDTNLLSDEIFTTVCNYSNGDPIINLNTMNAIAKFIPTNESLISLKLAYNKWMNIFNSTYDDPTNLDEIFGYNCQRLSLILRYVITKLLN
ncbi:Alpha-2-macroglobulin-like protein [Schistosoma japonicum]|uniref:Alpha-2-macroglobulin-like protein n=2 Tax=Schistosoma japonicum TaxID=6182 RepID=A0A4Z2DTS1_SCHJA|nr:Alpha-2-macroglobulin-like protein [Schistosoma japonicum]